MVSSLCTMQRPSRTFACFKSANLSSVNMRFTLANFELCNFQGWVNRFANAGYRVNVAAENTAVQVNYINLCCLAFVFLFNTR
jgi:hypothetical protein